MMNYISNKVYGFNNKLNKWLSDRYFRREIMIGNSNEGVHYISFTFDDFPKSASTTALDILNKYEAKGTYYTSYLNRDKVLFGKKLYSGSDLIRVQEDGHEIGCHTYDHIDCKKENYFKVKNSISENDKHLRTIINDLEFKSFSFPFGRYDFLSKTIVNKRFLTGRTTKSGINHGLVDVCLLKANQLYSNTIPFQKCFDLIDLNKKKNGWLIFYTHEVEEEPTQFGCTPEYFEKVVNYAVKSNAKIYSVSESYELIN